MANTRSKSNTGKRRKTYSNNVATAPGVNKRKKSKETTTTGGDDAQQLKKLEIFLDAHREDDTGVPKSKHTRKQEALIDEVTEYLKKAPGKAFTFDVICLHIHFGKQPNGILSISRK